MRRAGSEVDTTILVMNAAAFLWSFQECQEMFVFPGWICCCLLRREDDLNEVSQNQLGLVSKASPKEDEVFLPGR